MTPEDRTLRARLGAHISHANNPDGAARTSAARMAAAQRFEKKAREMHPNGTDDEIRRAAEHLRKAHAIRMAAASAAARRAKAAAKNTPAA